MLVLILGLLAIPAVVLSRGLPAATRSFANTETQLAPLYDSSNEPVDNNYIVVFKPNTPQTVINGHTALLHTLAPQSNNDGIRHIYSATIQGYSGSFDQRTLNVIRSAPEVAYVELDQVVRVDDVVQEDAPWGLARISQRGPVHSQDTGKYVFNPSGGEGVDVYLLDTGINVHHENLEGRARWGFTATYEDVEEDGHGHGTHCAGTIASRDYGVAKRASLVAVKILNSDGRGTTSELIRGIDWAADQASKRAKEASEEELRTGVRSTFKGSIASMSVGGGPSRAEDAAVNAAVDSGLLMALSAGNNNMSACEHSPGSAEKPITVGATDFRDNRAYFSNWGRCVDVFAPGVRVVSLSHIDLNGTAIKSGTSMATPHVAGLLAYLLSIYPDPEFNQASSYLNTLPGLNTILSIAEYIAPSYFNFASSSAPIPRKKLTPLILKKAILKLATRDAIADVQGSPNLLIFNNATLSESFWDYL